MKTHQKFLRLPLVAALSGALLVCTLAIAGEANPCKATARLVLDAARASADSDYKLALARASTLADATQRKAAEQQAKVDWKENKDLAKEQYNARLTVCELVGTQRYDPVINPADFLSPQEIATNSNPYLPLVPGTTFHYRGDTAEGVETNVVRVTHETKQILGVTAIVVRDTVWLNGQLKEDTQDWFAQDRTGNVWYFGELTLSYEDGELAGIEGSWEAGKEGGKPGLIMKANPQPGDAYRQEFAAGVVEDAAQVLALNQSATVPYGSFTNCLKTGEFTPMEPETVDSFDEKFYAPGIGFVLEISHTGERSELIAIEHE